jgi:hypothetical protein
MIKSSKKLSKNVGKMGLFFVYRPEEGLEGLLIYLADSNLLSNTSHQSF